MDPVQPPECIGRKLRRVVNNCPIFVDEREKSIHQVWHVPEVRRYMTTDVNWLFTITPTELRNICDGRVIQSPKGVFVEGFNALSEANLQAVRQEVILAQEVLLLDPRE